MRRHRGSTILNQKSKGRAVLPKETAETGLRGVHIDRRGGEAMPLPPLFCRQHRSMAALMDHQ